MRTFLLPALLLLAACEQKAAEAPPAEASARPQAAVGAVVFAGAGRNRLCLDERANRAAFITYAEGDTNCTMSGVLKRSDANATLVPDGDASCTVVVQFNGDEVRLGELRPECAYYCGPSASYAGSTYRRTNDGQPVTDLAGQPLC